MWWIILGIGILIVYLVIISLCKMAHLADKWSDDIYLNRGDDDGNN